jgi:hypothetical protein
VRADSLGLTWSGRGDATILMHAASDSLRLMNRAFNNPTSVHDRYDNYAALLIWLMDGPASIV